MNSCVPKWFDSVSSRQRPKRRGRRRTGPDAVAPVILVGKAAPRPAHHDMAKLLDVLDQLAADAVDIRDLRIGADPDAVVDHAADVLGKLAVDRRLDRADRLVQQDRDRERGGCTGAARGTRGKPPRHRPPRRRPRPAAPARPAGRSNRFACRFPFRLLPESSRRSSLARGAAWFRSTRPRQYHLSLVFDANTWHAGVLLMSRVCSTVGDRGSSWSHLPVSAVAISLCLPLPPRKTPSARTNPSSRMWCCAAER